MTSAVRTKLPNHVIPSKSDICPVCLNATISVKPTKT